MRNNHDERKMLYECRAKNTLIHFYPDEFGHLISYIAILFRTKYF